MRNSKGALGDKTQVPSIPIAGEATDDDAADGISNADTNSISVENNEVQVDDTDLPEHATREQTECLPDTADVTDILEDVTLDDNEIKDKTVENEVEHVIKDDWKDKMDSLLENCFLQALLNAKKMELPVLISSFTKQQLFPLCPDGYSIDVKKTQFKKMSKFLAYLQENKVIQVKEISKGVDGLASINYESQMLIEFSRTLISRELKKKINEEKQKLLKEAQAQDKKPEIVELYTVSGKTSSFFKMVNIGKGTVMSTSEIRQTITTYVKTNNLICAENSRLVSIDPHMADVILKKGESQNKMAWDILLARFVAEMNKCYEIRIPGQQPILRKGKFEPIEVKTEKRMGNKKVTLIKGLEQFGIDVKEFSQALQHAAASSTTVNALPGKTIQGSQVMVQGSQLKHVADVLATFNIPSKYVLGLEKASKSSKR